MSSDKHCCVPGCKETGGTRRVLHRFPNPEKDKERFIAWVHAIGGDILGLSNEHIHKYRRVCFLHFDEKYKCRSNRITNIAVPTLNIPDLLSSTRELLPMRHISNLSYPSTSKGPESHTVSIPTHEGGGGHLQKENVDPNVLEQEQAPNVHSIQTKDDLLSSTRNLEHLPMRQISNLSYPSTSKGPGSHTVSMPTHEGGGGHLQKENVDPNVLEQEQAPNVHSIQTKDDSKVLEQNQAPNVERAQQKEEEKRVKKNTRRIYITRKEKELHDQIIATKIKIYKMKNKIKRQTAEIKAAKKFATNPGVLDVIENCSSVARLIMKIQWSQNKKKDKGRRFTLQQKIASLSILKQSPKGYRFLRSIFILPAPQSLIKLIQKSNLKPGLNKKIFSQIAKKAETMTSQEKLCIVLFDEISLKAHISYNERKDKVTGFVDDGQQRKQDYADHAQVFMVRGLINNYKQAISYTFSASATKGLVLAIQIKMIISQLQEAGLIPLATVCDQGTNNRQAINILLNETRGFYLRRKETPKENIIIINDKEIIPLYDPPHLLKGMRNNLLTKNLKYVQDGITKTAKWSHLKLLHDENPGYKGIRLVPKLTDNHVIPEKINKMKVKFASQIFSRTVASNMGYLSGKGVLPSEVNETADFLLLMDEIFDSVNGSFRKNKWAKPLLGPATPNSVHYKTWAEAKKILKTMSFITVAGKEEIVPTVKNWIWTLEGIEVLLKKLKNEFNITSVWLRHLNQDPLENFFGAVRSHGCRNINPTCEQFESAFATLLINSLNSVHSRGKNCEGDFCDALHALIVEDDTEATTTACVLDVDFENILNINFTSLEEKEMNPRILAPLQYMSGYFLKKAKTNIFKNCEKCTESLVGNDEIEYIKYREYTDKRWLCTPSNDLINLISNMQDLVNEIIKENLEKNYLKEVIRTSVFLLIDFNFIGCKTHQKKLIDYLINIVVRCLLFNYCKDINKILTGRRNVADDDDKFQIKAKKFYSKCFKRKKKDS